MTPPLHPSGVGYGSVPDIEANRRARKWTAREQAGRLLWDLARPLFLFSPRQLWGWRRFLLRMFGAEIGARVHVCPTVRITIPWNLRIGDHVGIGDRAILYALGPIRIGRAATISQGAHLCAGTHDHRCSAMPLVKRPIVIGEGAWVCADAFVGPGAVVGDLAIVGARAVVFGKVAAGAVMVGNPARFVRTREFGDG